MNRKEIQVDRLLKTITNKDMLFKGDYTLDPYQNCSFGCPYCDSSLEDTIYVKINALEILDDELKTVPPGRIIIGSVHDPYQPVEQEFFLTHRVLQRLLHSEFSVHILTKSPTILNDKALLKQLPDPLVTFTLLSLDEQYCTILEPNAPHPLDRLDAMKTLAEQGITTGIALIPVLPFFSETLLDGIITKAKDYHASYVIYKPLFLQGTQKQVFLKRIKNKYPTVWDKYQTLYSGEPTPPLSVMKPIFDHIQQMCTKLSLPTTIPKNK